MTNRKKKSSAKAGRSGPGSAKRQPTAVSHPAQNAKRGGGTPALASAHVRTFESKLRKSEEGRELLRLSPDLVKNLARAIEAKLARDDNSDNQRSSAEGRTDQCITLPGDEFCAAAARYVARLQQTIEAYEKQSVSVEWHRKQLAIWESLKGDEETRDLLKQNLDKKIALRNAFAKGLLSCEKNNKDPSQKLRAHHSVIAKPYGEESMEIAEKAVADALRAPHEEQAQLRAKHALYIAAGDRGLTWDGDLAVLVQSDKVQQARKGDDDNWGGCVKAARAAVAIVCGKSSSNVRDTVRKRRG